MSELVYCAIPSRLRHLVTEVNDYVSVRGHGPLNPFQAFEYERFEGGAPGRVLTLLWTRRLVSIADQVWLFGVSEGALRDACIGILLQKRVLAVRGFDPNWDTYWSALAPSFGTLLPQELPAIA